MHSVGNVVSDTGPLIALAQIGHFDLLRLLSGQVIIPPAVRAEIQDEVSLAVLTASNWISVQPVHDSLAVQLLREELDAGESAAIILARELDADLILIDERAAHLSAIKPLLDSLHDHDFRMGASLYDQVLRDANEL